jgi:hypothetical protein
MILRSSLGQRVDLWSAGSDLDATFDGPASTVELTSCMPRIPGHALLLGLERLYGYDLAR